MIIIAHRGNINGPNEYTENNPFYIEKVIKNGFYVEIDVWYINNQLYLGHDKPCYKINEDFIIKNKNSFFCHCKNIEAIYYILKIDKNVECFFHDSDDCVLTSKNNIWTFPGKHLTEKSICVMPEKYISLKNEIPNSILNCYGICTDYPELLKKKINF